MTSSVIFLFKSLYLNTPNTKLLVTFSCPISIPRTAPNLLRRDPPTSCTQSTARARISAVLARRIHTLFYFTVSAENFESRTRKCVFWGRTALFFCEFAQGPNPFPPHCSWRFDVAAPLKVRSDKLSALFVKRFWYFYLVSCKYSKIVESHVVALYFAVLFEYVQYTTPRLYCFCHQVEESV